jgi:hypothetical protein
MLRSASAALRVTGSGLDFDALDARFGHSLHAHRAGDRSRSGTVYKHDLWSLESALAHEEVPGAHLAWLAERLHPHLDYLRALKETATVDVFCAITSDDGSGFALPPDALALPAGLGIPIEVSLHLYRDDEV